MLPVGLGERGSGGWRRGLQQCRTYHSHTPLPKRFEQDESGTEYVGSHVAVALSEAGHEILLLDYLCHSSGQVVDRINSLADRNIEFVEADVRDRDHLESVLSTSIDAVVHCAVSKSVEDSIVSHGHTKLMIDAWA